MRFGDKLYRARETANPIKLNMFYIQTIEIKKIYNFQTTDAHVRKFVHANPKAMVGVPQTIWFGCTK